MDSLRQWWRGLNEGERRAIIIVAPIVAVALIVAALRGRQRAAEESAAAEKATQEQITETSPGGVIPGGYAGQPGDAVGVDQLAQFETMFTSALGEAFGAIDALGSGVQSQFGSLTEDLAGQINVISDQVENLAVGANSPQADPDDTPVVTTQPPSTTRKPVAGWDLVRDNVGAYFVVKWADEARFNVQARDLDRARKIFGAPLTKISQAPAKARGEQREFIAMRKRQGTTLPADPIYLDQRMGWRDRGPWTNQGTR